MTIRERPTDLRTLEHRLRAMLGHLVKRDRDVVLEACEALVELAHRLHAVKATGVDPGDVEPSPLLDPPGQRFVTEQLAKAVTDPRRVRGLLVCGRRCRLHDECELACVLPVGHAVETPCRCEIAVEYERDVNARQKGQQT